MRHSLVATTGLMLLLSACGQTPSAYQPSATPGDQVHSAHMHGQASLGSQALGDCATDSARGGAAVASSVQNFNTPARAAVDGDPATRWSSEFSDDQWLQVNLGGMKDICQVTLSWEYARAETFQLQVSDDSKTWRDLGAPTAGQDGQQTVTVSGKGQYVRMKGLKRHTGYGYSLLEFQVFTSGADGGGMPMPGGEYVLANPPVTGVVPSQKDPPHRYFHEFQANCAVSRTTLPDDPIVFFGKPGASHTHTFLGNTTTNAASTLASLQAGSTACVVPGDKSAYWMPTMFNGDQEILPVGPQVIYYKTGVLDYTSVRPFPPGLRYVVGNMKATPEEFLTNSVEGWECGNSSYNADIPASCPQGTQINVRYQAPSCWDGIHLDTPNHQSHMAYPVAGRCTASHPVAVPMLEFKMAFPVSGDTSKVRLASGRGYSFHYDFYNAWEPATLKAMVDQCIVGGLQCNARGYDEAHPEAGAALGLDYRLP